MENPRNVLMSDAIDEFVAACANGDNVRKTDPFQRVSIDAPYAEAVLKYKDAIRTQSPYHGYHAGNLHDDDPLKTEFGPATILAKEIYLVKQSDLRGVIQGLLSILKVYTMYPAADRGNIRKLVVTKSMKL